MNSVGIVIQARMGSSRLPGKVLKEVSGEPLLGFLLSRLRASFKENLELIVATSDRSEDVEIMEYCRSLGINCFCGSEIDVYSRYLHVYQNTGLSHIIRLTADNPLIDLEVIRVVLESHLDSGADISSTRKLIGQEVVERYVPKGHSVDIIKTSAFERVDSTNLSEFEREHVIPVFFNGDFSVNCVNPNRDDLSEMTVDTQSDLERLKNYLNTID